MMPESDTYNPPAATIEAQVEALDAYRGGLPYPGGPRRINVGTAADPTATLAQPAPVAPGKPAPADDVAAVAAEAQELLAAARGLADRAADLESWAGKVLALRDQFIFRASTLRDEAAALLGQPRAAH